VTDSVEPNAGWGKLLVLGLLLWAVIGLVIVFQNEDTLSQGLRVALVWPAFLFIAPPGWYILMLISRAGQRPTPASSISPESWGPPSETDSKYIVDSAHAALPQSTLTESPPDTVTENCSNSGLGDTTIRNDLPLSISEGVPFADDSPRVAFLSQASMDSWSTSEIEELAKEHDWICQLCLKPLIEDGIRYQSFHPRGIAVDFIVPLAHGGSEARSNAQPVHVACKSAKGDRRISNFEFRTERWTSIEPIGLARPTLPTRSNQPHLSSSPSRPLSGRTPRSSTARGGEWKDANAVIQRMLRELHTANLSDEQRDRAVDFIHSTHDYDLLAKCQRGHLFTLQNTYFSLTDTGRVERQCRLCRRLSR
jgi:hypothetical protein